MPIITKRGDQGTTDLLFNKTVHKSSDRIEAIGAVDELNAYLGIARVHAEAPDLIDWIDNVQKNLINLMGELATEPVDLYKYQEKGFGQLSEEDILALEALAQTHEDGGNSFRGWARPGKDGSLLAASLHVCRTACRRAERRSWALEMDSRVTCLYLNRLADVLWLITNAA